MKNFKKQLSIFIVAMMLLGLFPAMTSAEDTTVKTFDSVTLEIDSKGVGRVYANGIPILIKLDSDNKTYIYDISGQTKLVNVPIDDKAKMAGVYGGTKDGDTVASTKIVMESGITDTIYGGGRDGFVSGQSEVIIKGGFCSKVYGGSLNKSVGSVRIEYNGTGDAGPLQSLVVGGGNKGAVLGDTEIILNNVNLTTLYGGNNGGTGSQAIAGDINITINSGYIGNILGGCNVANVKGTVYLTVNGPAVIDKDGTGTGMVQATGKTGVAGGAKVFVPDGFPQAVIEKIIAADQAQTAGGIVRIYKNGSRIYPYTNVTTDGNGNIFANGLPVSIRSSADDGKTYIYESDGVGKLLSDPVDNCNIFGGRISDDAGIIQSTSILMESGKVAAIYGGGMTGTVTGDSSVTINGGISDKIFSGGLTGTVNGTGFVKINDNAAVAGVTNSINAGNAASSVIWVPGGYNTDKIFRNSNTRIFTGSVEVPDTSISIPAAVTETFIDNEYNVFANGIPIIIKKDASDGRTYIYDLTGVNKLLSSEVNGHIIYGGSEKGVVSSTQVTMESGTVSRIYGGGYTGCVEGLAKITVTGGDITENIYGGSYDGDVGSTDIYVNGPYIAKGVVAGSRNGCVIGNTNVLLIDNVGKGLYAGTGGDGRGIGYPQSDVLGNASYTVSGGMAEAIYGGCKSGVVQGTSEITLDGQVIIKTAVKPQSNGGVLGGTTVNVPANFIYMDKIITGSGITINLTQDAPIEPAPQFTVQTDKIMSSAEDTGKLVYRFINVPEPDGELTGRPGEMIYITFPTGENMLIDTGADTDNCRNIFMDLKNQLGITSIDYIVATHYHADHIGSMADILNLSDITIGKLLAPDTVKPASAAALNSWMTANPEKVQYLWCGDTFNIGDVQVEVLNPTQAVVNAAASDGTFSTDDYNNTSLVLKFTYGEHTSIMAADMYIAAEKELVGFYEGTDKLDVDLIKVPHHGDTTSSDPEFVNAVSPDVAVITHFSDTIIVNNRYRTAGAKTYITGIDGDVKLTYDGTNSAPKVIQEFYVSVPVLEVSSGAGVVLVDSTTQAVASFTYSMHDQYEAIPIDPSRLIRTITDEYGNIINDPAITFENDILTITGKPQVPYIVVNYIYENVTGSTRIVFEPVPFREYTVAIEGADEIKLTPVRSETEVYTIVVKNSKGQVVTGVPISLNLVKYTGLDATINGNCLTVTNYSTSGTLTLNAVFEETNDAACSKNIKVKGAPVAVDLDNLPNITPPVTHLK